MKQIRAKIAPSREPYAPKGRRSREGPLAGDELLEIHADLSRQGHPICKRMAQIVNQIVKTSAKEGR